MMRARAREEKNKKRSFHCFCLPFAFTSILHSAPLLMIRRTSLKCSMHTINFDTHTGAPEWQLPRARFHSFIIPVNYMDVWLCLLCVCTHEGYIHRCFFLIEWSNYLFYILFCPKSNSKSFFIALGSNYTSSWWCNDIILRASLFLRMTIVFFVVNLMMESYPK